MRLKAKQLHSEATPTASVRCRWLHVNASLDFFFNSLFNLILFLIAFRVYLTFGNLNGISLINKLSSLTLNAFLLLLLDFMEIS